MLQHDQVINVHLPVLSDRARTSLHEILDKYYPIIARHAGRSPQFLESVINIVEVRDYKSLPLDPSTDGLITFENFSLISVFTDMDLPSHSCSNFITRHFDAGDDVVSRAEVLPSDKHLHSAVLKLVCEMLPIPSAKQMMFRDTLDSFIYKGPAQLS